MISNRILIIFLGCCLFLNILEFFIFYKTFLVFLILKIFIFLITAFLAFLLFSLKILGGSDGKLIIIIFITYPMRFLKITNILCFFLILSFLFLIIFFTNYLINCFSKDSFSFDILFNLGYKISIFKKFFIKMFYSFFPFLKFKKYREIKRSIRSQFIFYNNRTNSFQYLAQYKFPFVLICTLSYYFLLFLKIGI